MALAIERKLSAFNDIALLIGRILMAALFVIAAINVFRNLGGNTTYFARLGIPAPGAMAPFVASYELVLGVLLIVGFHTRLVALGLAILTVFAALIAHSNFADANQLNHFLKCLGVIGGCLAFMVSGAGAFSVDARRR
jgi:putative oxidoreductase